MLTQRTNLQGCMIDIFPHPFAHFALEVNTASLCPNHAFTTSTKGTTTKKTGTGTGTGTTGSLAFLFC